MSGPGTHLSLMLGRFGIHEQPGCKCKSKAALMDRQGPDWCEQNLERIIGWLRAEAGKRRLPFLEPVARMLVRRAIAKARAG